jgi:molybdopterin converting factor small subunit
MAMKVHLFGQLKQITGSSTLELDEISDTDQLIERMKLKYPLLENLTYLIAVDKTIVHSKTLLKQGQELALLPPYSGG